MADITPIRGNQIFDEWAIKTAKLIRWGQTHDEIVVALKDVECPNIPRAINQGRVLAQMEELTDRIIANKKYDG